MMMCQPVAGTRILKASREPKVKNTRSDVSARSSGMLGMLSGGIVALLVIFNTGLLITGYQSMLVVVAIVGILLSLAMGGCLLLLLRRQAGERQLFLEGESFRKSVLDAVAAEIAVVDRDGRIVAVNEPWCQFARDNSSARTDAACSMLGSNYFEVCNVDPASDSAQDAALARQGILAVLNGRRGEFSMDYPCDSPTEKRWFTLVVRPLGEGASQGLVMTHVDVTRLKEAEAQAKDELVQRQKAETETRKLMQAIEQSPIAMFITDPVGRIEYANPRFLLNTGYEAEELIGKTPAVLKSPQTQDAVHARLWQTIQAGKAWRGVLCNRRKDGSLLWEDTSIAPIFDQNGQITHYAAVKADVTESLRNERELAEYRLRLEDLVELRTAELRDALVAAQAADRAKNEFLANITHELRTPLNSVIGFSNLARPLASNAKQRDYLDKVICSGSSLAATIDDLLDLSKIAAGCMSFELKPFSVRGLVARCNSVISYKVSEKGLQLSQTVDAAVPDVLVGDPLRIEQILLNLLSNAVKFTDQGEVRLEIALLGNETERVHLRVSVEDTGIGMQAHEIANLFKPFAQADASITRRFGGTGLGLAICDKLAKMMDGSIQVNSEPGGGTRFDVDLWVGRSLSVGDLADDTYARGSLPLRYVAGTRVLVVDDQAFNRELVAALLAQVGICVELVGNGEEAINRLQADPTGFDIVLMDIQMPVMDGRTAAREIRSMPTHARLPIIAMTAHTMLHELERSAEAGMNDHIGKPFNRQHFYRTLARWIPREKQAFDVAHAVLVETQDEPGGLPAMEGIDSVESLRLMQGNVQRYTKWLNDFLASGPGMLSEIHVALQAGEAEKASMAAHRLKGRCGFLGMKQAHGLSGELELAINAGNAHEACLASLDTTISRLCEQIKAAMV